MVGSRAPPNFTRAASAGPTHMMDNSMVGDHIESHMHAMGAALTPLPPVIPRSESVFLNQFEKPGVGHILNTQYFAFDFTGFEKIYNIVINDQSTFDML